MRYVAALLLLYGCASPMPSPLRDVPQSQGIDKFVSSLHTHRDINATVRPGEEPFVAAARADLSNHFTGNGLQDSFGQYISGEITSELRSFFIDEGMIITNKPLTEKPEIELWPISSREKVEMELWGTSVKLERRILGDPIIKGRYEENGREAWTLGTNSDSSSIETFSRNIQRQAASMYRQYQHLKDAFENDELIRVESVSVEYTVSQFMIYKAIKPLCEGTEEESVERIRRLIDNTLVIHEAAHALFHNDCKERSERFRGLYIFNAELVARLTELRYAPKPSLVLGQQIERAIQRPYGNTVDVGSLACGATVNMTMNTAVANKEKLQHADMSRFLKTRNIDDAFAELPELTDAEIRQLAAAIVKGTYLKHDLPPAESFLKVIEEQEELMKE